MALPIPLVTFISTLIRFGSSDRCQRVRFAQQQARIRPSTTPYRGNLGEDSTSNADDWCILGVELGVIM